MFLEGEHKLNLLQITTRKKSSFIELTNARKKMHSIQLAYISCFCVLGNILENSTGSTIHTSGFLLNPAKNYTNNYNISVYRRIH